MWRLCKIIMIILDYNPHPEVVNNPPKSLGGGNKTGTRGLAPCSLPPDIMVSFWIARIKCADAYVGSGTSRKASLHRKRRNTP